MLAGLLARDVALLPEASRPLVFGAGLDLAHAGDAAAYGGPRLARTVLDLGLRTRAFSRLAAVDTRLHDRVAAVHLVARPPAQPPAAGGLDGQEWWERAVEFTAHLVAAGPARLVVLVFSGCPPEHAGQLQAQVRTALGTPPPSALLGESLPAGADQVDGTREPLASWLRVWDWSPVLPAGVLASWEPVLDAVRRRKPAGPRTTHVPDPASASTALAAEDLEQTAAECGPAPAAAVLAEAEDAGSGGYAMVLHHLVATDPAAWTSDVPAVLNALVLPEFGAFYLAAAAVRIPDEVLQTGVWVPALHRYAAEYHPALYRIAPGWPSPAAVLAALGPPSPPLLAALDRTDLIGALRAAPGLAQGTAAHTAAAFLADPAFLGDPSVWWAELARATGTGDGDGAAAVTGVLEAIAARTPHTGADGPLPSAEQVRVQAAVDLWRARARRRPACRCADRGGRVRRRGRRRAGVAGVDGLQRPSTPRP
ncbi:hypothetical protein [Streptomyces hygroscopicus]|uniref:hypothetical protein n=1 Tax=Streptomyces hygroscopicus TaxID=1912 RepID=UPI0007801F87|nr:hypothetical protein [Streptomyces hygroscopicus]